MGKIRAKTDPITLQICTQGCVARTDFKRITIASALTSLPRPDIPSNVGFQAWDRSTWPCGREGELNPRAAMCDAKGRGSENREQNVSL